MNLFNGLLFIAGVYIASSIEEWIVHKYVMHTHSDVKLFRKMHENHAQHHYKTKSDYTVGGDTEYICVDIKTVDDVIQYTVVFVFNYGLFYVMCSNYIPAWFIASTILAFIGINILVWNTFHSYIHGMDAYEICYSKGIPAKYLNEKNFYVNWIVNNHRAHHKNSRGNFNIVFPGADFWFGTYNKLID